MTTRRVIDFAELACTLATRVVVLPVPELRFGRVVVETATEKDFGPRMRRTMVVAAAPKTLRRAEHFALNEWGIRLPESDRSPFLVSGRHLLIPLDTNPGGYIPCVDYSGYEGAESSPAWHEWEIRL